MRLLLLLPWCFIISLVAATACNLKMPEESESCEEIIRWKHRNDKEATSTCLEYFPTTFLKGESNDAAKTEIKCTVYRQFECKHMPGTIPMFDKCYKFTDQDMTIEEYIAEGHKTGTTTKPEICGPDGALPIFFTMSQGKHIAMEAHRQKIEKIWVNLDKNGKTIDEPTDEKSKRVKKEFLLYKNLWKVHDDVYWNGDNLVKITKKETKDGPNKGKPILPPGVDYLFFRSRTDYVYNLYQGSFERVMKNSGTKARVVCEYPAKIVPDQDKYCEKLGEKGLGLNAKSDNSRGRKRCVYTTLSKFSLKGTKAAIEEFTGCDEKPSYEHKAGLDDGTAQKSLYKALTATGTYRVAAIKTDLTLHDWNRDKYAKDVRKHCDSSPYNSKHRQIYRIFDHFGRQDFASKMNPDWTDKYPKDECSDFPSPSMDSNTLAIHYTKIIDVPVPVRLRAICSIEANLDCELHHPCEKYRVKNTICSNVETWNPETKLYAECKCGPFHHEYHEDCAWETDPGSCARIRQHEGVPRKWAEVYNTDWTILWDLPVAGFADNVDEVVVRNGCWIKIFSHPTQGDSSNYVLLDTKDKMYGRYVVPHHLAGTLNGWDTGMDASAFECHCKDGNPFEYPPKPPSS